MLGAASLVSLSGLSGVTGCGKNTGGNPTGQTPSATASAAAKGPVDPAEAVPGIVATLPDHIPPNALACVPSPGTGHPTPATVSDPAAPRITIDLPDGWNSVAGTGDTALTMTGPGGMSATVTIASTDLQPDSAFLRYTAAMGGARARLKFSVAGAPFCGYSSQQLTMTVQGPSGRIDYADRITHIWTNTNKYLVAVHLEGPAGAAGFGTAKSTLMQQFTVVIP
ncbi:MAG: hypothetical protein QOH91_2591 [Mycobacterium sp.]|nr:hypothetical protein [Mycobacterium sp.]